MKITHKNKSLKNLLKCWKIFAKIPRKFREITKTKISQPPYVGVQWGGGQYTEYSPGASSALKKIVLYSASVYTVGILSSIILWVLSCTQFRILVKALCLPAHPSSPPIDVSTTRVRSEQKPTFLVLCSRLGQFVSKIRNWKKYSLW